MDAQTVIAIAVGLHLIGALYKSLVHDPKRQAQADAIEAKLDALLGQTQKGGAA